MLVIDDATMKNTIPQHNSVVLVKSKYEEQKMQRGCGKNNTEPIRDISSVMKIKEYLIREGHLRDELLFTMGINNSLQTVELLRLKIGDVCHLRPGDYVNVDKSKKKESLLIINNAVFYSLVEYLKHRIHDSNTKLQKDEYLFQSRKGGKHLSLPAVNLLVKSWAAMAELKGNYGANSLRKTWGYHQAVRFGVDPRILSKRFNHKTPTVTLKYLGLDRHMRNTPDYLLIRNEIGVLRKGHPAPNITHKKDTPNTEE